MQHRYPDRFTDGEYERWLEDIDAMGCEMTRLMDRGELITTEALLRFMAERGCDESARELARREAEQPGEPDYTWGGPWVARSDEDVARDLAAAFAWGEEVAS